MSDDIMSVFSPYADVASLAQGYLNRADGERLLLPLATASNPGSGVRFVVYLADGTPAFAGAGLCVQVSDQGSTVPPAQRFESLLDTLQFDARSRPVYDYIVAVRTAAYVRPASDDVEEVHADAVESAHPATNDEHATASVAPAHLETASDEAAPDHEQEALIEVDTAASIPAPAQAIHSGSDPAPPGAPSFVPPPIPTGLLARPARAVHWQPAAPRRATPRIATGLFRYAPGVLPRPARPPRPDLDPARQVQPAPRPA